mmetsp:Transcript_2280/g.4801  ORF Transcript_2280/g.4801 Transcript_2280/m.4801 type:complete len:127 (+) Transcript_2280:710-1090(+)
MRAISPRYMDGSKDAGRPEDSSVKLNHLYIQSRTKKERKNGRRQKKEKIEPIHPSKNENEGKEWKRMERKDGQAGGHLTPSLILSLVFSFSSSLLKENCSHSRVRSLKHHRAVLEPAGSHFSSFAC